MSLISKIMKKSETKETTTKKVEKKAKSSTKKGVNGKEAYKIEKAARKEVAKKRRLEEQKELEKQVEQAEVKRLSDAKIAEGIRIEKLENARAKAAQTKVQEQEEEIKEEEMLDLFGFDVEMLERGQMIKVEVLEEERENYLVRSKSNYQEAKLPKAELGGEKITVGQELDVIVWKYYADEFYVSLRRYINKMNNTDKAGSISADSILTAKVISYKEPVFYVQMESGAEGKVFVRNMDIKFVDSGDAYIGNSYEFIIIKRVEGARPNQAQFELSRRAVLEHKQKNIVCTVEEHQIIEIETYEFNKGGMSFEFDGMRGFVPISELSHKFYANSEAASKDFTGKLKVKVKKIKRERGNINLISSIKALSKAPFENFVETNHVGDVVSSKVFKKETFGIIMEIEDGLRGLLHNTEITPEVAASIKDLKVGDVLQTKIKEIDGEKNKISLTLFLKKQNSAE